MAGQLRCKSIGVVLAALSLTSMMVQAQTLPTPDTPAATTQQSADDSSAPDVPNSTEQGHTTLPDSFDHRPVQALLRDSKLVGLRDTTFNVQLRSFYEDQQNFNGSTSLAWTLGGVAGFKTGYFWDFAALGVTSYTSQRLYAPLDESGTKLLQPEQRAYTVIGGELYGQFRLTDEIVAIAGRKGLDTPYINTQDSLMTPNTFQVYAVQGVVGGTDDSSTLRFGAGYFDKIKARNSEDFVSMASAAGAPTGVDRGVYVAGANYKVGQFSIGAIDYYSADIINIDFAEINYAIPLPEDLRLQLAAEYTDQRSTGEDLLTRAPFSTDQYGLKAELVIGTALLTVARTVTAIGTLTTAANGESGTSIRSPWGGYPGYTSVQIENFYRAGENATMLRAAYNLPKKTGLSLYGLWVHGSTPKVAGQYAQDEYDLNLQWSAQTSAMKGLKLVARYGHVAQEGPKDQHQNDLRLILSYQWR
jgi:outer membrane porin, OprD family